VSTMTGAAVILLVVTLVAVPAHVHGHVSSISSATLDRGL
jgi:hypothetical protein